MSFHIYLISYILFIINLSNTEVLEEYIDLKSQFDNLSLPKELILNTLSIVDLQSRLMIMSSERDFPFNVSSNTKLNYIRYPTSYRTTLLQVSSGMHDFLTNSYSTMYRTQLAVQRIPNHIKTILRLFSVGSVTMIERLLPTSWNNIVRIFKENEVFIKKTIDQLKNLFNLLNEIKQLPKDFSLKFTKNYSSNRTDLIVHNQFDSKEILEKLCRIIQAMKQQWKQILKLNTNTQFHLSSKDDIRHIIAILYNLETTAYFFYQLSDTYTYILDEYVLDQAVSMGKYVVLSTDEQRLTTLSDLSEQLANTSEKIENLFLERENDFEISNMKLQEAYENFFNEYLSKKPMVHNITNRGQ